MKGYFFNLLLDFFPQLGTQLNTARLKWTPLQFVKRTLLISSYMSLLILFILFLLFSKILNPVILILVGAPIIYTSVFLYFMQYPKVCILRESRKINRDIVYAGRFLVIELESGVPLYTAFMNIIPTYPNVGPYFREIITKVDLGTPIEDAINEAILYSPAQNLKRLLWQILNSLKIGSDVQNTLSSVVENIVRDQVVELKEYAKKLNPLAMFYMMAAIILPTLGIAMLAVVANFLGVYLKLPILLLITLFLAFIQFMFLQMIKSQRPAVEL